MDLWLLADFPFDRRRFARRQRIRAFGEDLAVSTSENTILQKLQWARMSGGSERHVQDAPKVFEVQRPVLDRAYLRERTDRLAVSDLLEHIEDLAGAE